jgi:putative membrane protein
MSEKKRDLILLLVVLGVLIVILPVLMWGIGGGYMLGMMGMMGYGWWFMPLILIVFLVLIVLGAYYLITELAGQGGSESKGEGRALEILKERYARGEITREQYLKMKEELES